MATRNISIQLKNSSILSRPLPASLYQGEPIVNTADGIVYFSGITQSINGWTPAGTGTTSNFFEVGSNLYDLRLRNRITKYEGLSGSSLNGKFLSGTTSGFVLADISSIVGSASSTITGGTPNNAGSLYTFTNSTGGTFNVLGLTDITITGGTYSNGITTFTNNTGGTFSVSGYFSADTFVTGFTYTAANNKLSIARNQGLSNLDVFITSVSGLTLSNLTADRLVYTTTDGALITSTATFNGTDMALPTTGSLTVGTGGLIIGSGGSPSVAGTGDLIVNGNLTVFGGSVSAFTSQLYVEDSNITVNYNPTGSTTATSIGAGLTVQDGNGVTSGNVTFDVRAMNGFTGLTASQIPIITEYTGATGFTNRAWVTQLNDIVVRSTNTTTPNGVRVLAEFDILDGGQY